VLIPTNETVYGNLQGVPEKMHKVYAPQFCSHIS